MSRDDWTNDKTHTRLLWGVHRADAAALRRPYRDFQDAAAYLGARLDALYDASGREAEAGAATGIDSHKIQGAGLQLDGETVAAVRAALRHLSARRIWSTRNTADHDINVEGFLAKFPNMRTHVDTVAHRFLQPAVESSQIAEDALYPQSCVSVDMQLRMQAQGDEDLLFQYVDFVADVVHAWHRAARSLDAPDFCDFDHISTYMHSTQGEDARDKIVMARQLCQIQYVQILAWEPGAVRLRAALPPPVRLRCAAPAAPCAHPPTWMSSMRDLEDEEKCEEDGAVHAVHFRLPDRDCPQVELELDADTARVVHVAPGYEPPPIEEPESLGILLLGISCGAAAVAAALLGAQRVEATNFTATMASLTSGVAGLCVGLFGGRALLLRLRAHRAWSVFNEWTCIHEDDQVEAVQGHLKDE